jgi:hypothetical protein
VAPKPIATPTSANKDAESPTKIPTGPKKALSSLYSDTTTAVKK